MRRTALGLILLVLPGAAAAADDADPAAVVRRAVEAAGGADVLAKFPAARVTASGKVFGGTGDPVPVRGEQVYQVPGLSRTRIRLDAGQPLDVLHVVNGPQVKYTINGSPVPTSDAAKKELQAVMLVQEAAHLTPLLDKRFTLKAEKPGKAADPDTVTLVASAKNAPDLRLTFDTKSGHLVKVARRAFDGATGKEFDQEQVFSDFKAFDGLTRPMKVVLLKDAQKTLELTTETFTPLEKADPREFNTRE